jgi:chromosome segregation protein
MKLTRLRLIGFKSFVEPTDFEIEPGLTGVVGPNGCGKSNLVEAVRWVMGEASYKAMRGAEMDDVIFSGNSDRQQRPQGAGGVQRYRHARGLAPYRPRAGLGVPR